MTTTAHARKTRRRTWTLFVGKAKTFYAATRIDPMRSGVFAAAGFAPPLMTLPALDTFSGQITRNKSSAPQRRNSCGLHACRGMFRLPFARSLARETGAAKRGGSGSAYFSLPITAYVSPSFPLNRVTLVLCVRLGIEA